MKNWKQSAVFGIVAIIALIIGITACNGNNPDVIKQELTGTVIIDNMSPKAEETITATYNRGNGSGVETWQWKRGNTAIPNENSNSYTVVALDIGNTLTAIVSFSDQNGYVSTTTNAVAPAITEPAPNSFNNLNGMSAYLASLEENTKDTPYEIILYGLNISSSFYTISDPLGGLFNALNGKYVVLDLSACIGTSIPDILYWNTPNLRNNKDKLVSIILPSSITSIGDYAFLGCSGLTSATLGSGLTNIGNSVFSSCNDLIAINVASDNSTYSSVDGILYNKAITSLIMCPLGRTSVIIPNSVTAIFSDAFDFCTKLVEINVDSDNSNFSSFDGILYNKDKTNLRLCPEGRERTVTISNSVNIISSYAFYRCSKVINVIIPESVTYIGNGAFLGCTGLTNIIIPSSVTQILDSAFLGCIGLISVTFEGFIGPGNFSSSAFDGDLRDKYMNLDTGLAGTYITTNPGNSAVWMKQQ